LVQIHFPAMQLDVTISDLSTVPLLCSLGQDANGLGALGLRRHDCAVFAQQGANVF
jgi:hypothetical protein